MLVVQTVTAVLAFRLDREPLRPLWTLPLQQFVYRQVMYLVLLQSAMTALTGRRLGWQKLRRTGDGAVASKEYSGPLLGTARRVPSSADMLGDRYRLEEPIAAGGMGDVWRATDTVLGRDVAVKMLHARWAGDRGFRPGSAERPVPWPPSTTRAWPRSTTTAGPKTVTARTWSSPSSPASHSARHRRVPAGSTPPRRSPLLPRRRAHFMPRTPPGSSIATSNPAISSSSPTVIVVLVDFGIARSPESTDLTGISEVVGTALYLAPEQVTKQAIRTRPTLALGTVAYQGLAGHPPFLGDNPITRSAPSSHLNDDPPPLPADVPTPVRDLVATAMAKDPDDRFPTAAAMADAADTIADQVPALRAPHMGAPAADRTRTMVAPAALRARWGDRRARLGWGVLLVAFAMLGVIVTSTTPGALGPDPQRHRRLHRFQPPTRSAAARAEAPTRRPAGPASPDPNGATPGAPGPGSPGSHADRSRNLPGRPRQPGRRPRVRRRIQNRRAPVPNQLRLHRRSKIRGCRRRRVAASRRSR